MTGYNDEALEFMMKRLHEDASFGNEKLARDVFNLCLTYDVDYMASAGLIKNGEFADGYYNEDDAFDFIIDRISNARPEIDGDVLAELIELYIEYHDEYMDSNGLLEWD